MELGIPVEKRPFTLAELFDADEAGINIHDRIKRIAEIPEG